MVQMYVPEHIGGWWIREIAVKTAGGEVLAIGTVPPSYKPIMEEGSAAGTYYRVILEVSNASVVNLIVDPSTVMASKEDVEKLIAQHAAQTNVHGGAYAKTPNRLMLRNAKGQCQVADPENAADAAPKQWVEKTVDAKINASEAKVGATFDELMNGTIFPGAVMMFDGAFSGKHPINPLTNKPATKWHICDGTDGTPDLRDRFVIGASNTRKAGSKGGSLTHDHAGTLSGTTDAITLSTNQMPAHSHLIYGSATGSFSGSGALPSVSPSPFEKWETTQNTGGGQPHSHGLHGAGVEVESGGELPPYYALAYIKRMA